MVKGMFASGFCSPALTWAQAAAGARVRHNAHATFANLIVIFLAQTEVESKGYKIGTTCSFTAEIENISVEFIEMQSWDR